VVDGTGTLTLTQDMEIADSGKLLAPVQGMPFAGGKAITITGTGVLDFGTATATSIGATIVNKGTADGAITTATTSDVVLGVILGAGSKITATGAITQLMQNLLVPAGVDLTIGSSATFAGGAAYTVTIDGMAAFNAAATFSALTGAVTVNGKATFPGATFAALADTAGTASITVGADGDAEFPKATFKSATVGDIVVNGTAEFGGELAGGVIKAGSSGGIIFSDGSGSAAKIVADGIAAIAGEFSLENELVIGTTGVAALVPEAEVTLGAVDAKITGGAAYTITPETDQTTGALTAGDNDAGALFLADAIAGFVAPQDAPLSLTSVKKRHQRGLVFRGGDVRVWHERQRASYKGSHHPCGRDP
jgi:hypothetical protein